MKTPDPRRRESLSELLADTFVAGGPPIESVIEKIHAAKVRRESWRRTVIEAAALMMFAVLIGGGLHWRPERNEIQGTTGVTLESSSTTDGSGIFVEHVDDEGLLDILADQPLALVLLPGGERQLMMLVKHEESVIWNAVADRRHE